MFYGQCNKCGERWGLGTTPTCVCLNELVTVTPPQDRFRIDPVTGDVSIGTPPKREWVGLNPEDIPSDPDPRFETDEFLLGMKLAEAILKEKNT